MRLVLLSVLVVSGFVPAVLAELPPCRVAIQPLGKVGADVIRVIEQNLKARYFVEVEVLPRRELPASAYYKPRGRYRADQLLDWLANETPASFEKVIGVTASDISTTKGRIPDWGIFGLGEVNARPCVVSTFRLGRAVPRERMLARTGDVAGHEAGHTFGLQHCATPRCQMNDAEGKIRSVDESSGRLCTECRRLLAGRAREY